MKGLTLVTGPTKEPVTLDEAKDHLHIDFADHDATIAALIRSAREMLENDSGRALLTQTWNYVLDEFEEPIKLPKAPLQSVTSITYRDTAGDTQTFSSGSYVVDTDNAPGRIALEEGATWPSTDPVIGAITVKFVCGYGDDAHDVPELLRLAMLQLVAHWFGNREPLSPENLKEVTLSYERLMWQHRVMGFV